MKEITFDEKKKIVDAYISGINIKKLEKQFHTSAKKIKKYISESGIDIYNRNGIGPRIKHEKGYWNTKSNAESAAKQCRNRGEFSDRFSSAYKASKKNGWLDEFTNKYFSDRPEFPSLKSKIHVVYAYEIICENAVYVGRTTDLKRRDKQHRIDNKDILFKFCNKINSEIPSPRILLENIDAVESQIKENEFVEQYRKNGWNILNIANTGYGSSSLGSISPIWTYERCKIAAEECNSKEEFKKKYGRAHNVSRKNGWINEFFPVNMKKENGYFDSFDNCLSEAKKYDSIMDIRKNYPFLYQKISKHGWTKQIKEIIIQ